MLRKRRSKVAVCLTLLFLFFSCLRKLNFSLHLQSKLSNLTSSSQANIYFILYFNQNSFKSMNCFLQRVNKQTNKNITEQVLLKSTLLLTINVLFIMFPAVRWRELKTYHSFVVSAEKYIGEVELSEILRSETVKKKKLSFPS